MDLDNQYSIKSLVYELKLKFDYEYGGINKVQKFPMSNMWNSLYTILYLTKKKIFIII